MTLSKRKSKKPGNVIGCSEKTLPMRLIKLFEMMAV